MDVGKLQGLGKPSHPLCRIGEPRSPRLSLDQQGVLWVVTLGPCRASYLGQFPDFFRSHPTNPLGLWVECLLRGGTVFWSIQKSQ